MNRLRKALIFILLITLLMVPVCAYAAAPGSAGDPLVTESWVNNYLDQRFGALQQQLDELSAKIGGSVNISLNIGKNTATVNGVSRYIDPDRPEVVPVLKTDANGGGYTMLPIRFVAESLGVSVEWLPDTRTVVFRDGNNTVVLPVGSTDATINGALCSMPYPSYISSSRTFVHIRFVAEAFGCDVQWIQDGKRVEVKR